MPHLLHLSSSKSLFLIQRKIICLDTVEEIVVVVVVVVVAVDIVCYFIFVLSGV